MSVISRNDATAVRSGVFSTRSSRACLELAMGFVVVPLVIGLWLPPATWLPSLWLIALAAVWTLSRDAQSRPVRFCAPVNWQNARPIARRICLRFIMSAVVLATAMAIWAPAGLGDPLELHATQWIGFLVVYPLVSVFAQELLYRRYLFHRLQELNLSAGQVVWVSAIAFAAMHAIFRNEIAVGLTLIGGWFFSDTYRRTGSLRLVCLEHALYGNFVFAIGLWPFFSHDAVLM